MPGGAGPRSVRGQKPVSTHVLGYRGQMTVPRWKVRLDERRRPTLPPDLLEAAGIPAGAELTVRIVDDGTIMLSTHDAVRERIRRKMAPLKTGRSMVDELLAERRAEAEREISER